MTDSGQEIIALRVALENLRRHLLDGNSAVHDWDLEKIVDYDSRTLDRWKSDCDIQLENLLWLRYYIYFRFIRGDIYPLERCECQE